jgi:hypothetical protein
LVAIPIGVFVLFSPRNPKPLNEQDLKKYFGRVWGHLRDREVPGAIGASVMALVILFGTQLFYLPILMNDPFDALQRSAVSNGTEPAADYYLLAPTPPITQRNKMGCSRGADGRLSTTCCG